MSRIGGGPAPVGADIVHSEAEDLSQEVRTSPSREVSRL
jgi:hypothetical protein